MPLARGLQAIGRWLVFFATVLATAGHASERRYFFDEIGSARDLVSQDVTALFQDRTGYLWLGTQSGLQRYDGYNYHLFRHVPDEIEDGEPATAYAVGFTTAKYTEKIESLSQKEVCKGVCRVC